MFKIMPKSLTYLVSITIIASIEASLVLSAHSQPSNIQNECLSKTTSNHSFDKSAFALAVSNANNSNKCRQWSNLIQLNRANPNLIWNDDNQILMVSFQFQPDCNNESNKNVLSCIKKDKEDKEDKSYTVPSNPNDYPLWVTVVPEIKAFVVRETYKKSFPKSNPLIEQIDFLTKRIKQYLGLGSENNYNAFVEIWVAVDDVIRPCINEKDITNSSCSEWNDDQKANNRKFEKSLDSEYPFTGFGYTYDWGNPNTIVGTSEFVVREGANIKIKSIKNVMQYLQGLIPE